MNLILPQFLYSLIDNKQANSNFNNHTIVINAQSIQELFYFFSKNHPHVVSKIFTDDGSPFQSVIFVLNDQIVNKNDLYRITFEDNATLEMLFQFAGG